MIYHNKISSLIYTISNYRSKKLWAPDLRHMVSRIKKKQKTKKVRTPKVSELENGTSGEFLCELIATSTSGWSSCGMVQMLYPFFPSGKRASSFHCYLRIYNSCLLDNGKWMIFSQGSRSIMLSVILVYRVRFEASLFELKMSFTWTNSNTNMR